METTANIGYWASLITQIRKNLSLSQEAFAEAVFSNQATVSRWEKGLVVPTYDKQKKIEKLAVEGNVASLGGLVEVIRNSPSRMILIDEHEFVIAASATSEWLDNKSVLDQLSEKALHNYKKFSKFINDSGFWKSSGGFRLDNTFDDGLRIWHSVIISVVIRGTLYAVVQQVLFNKSDV